MVNWPVHLPDSHPFPPASAAISHPSQNVLRKEEGDKALLRDVGGRFIPEFGAEILSPASIDGPLYRFSLTISAIDFCPSHVGLKNLGCLSSPSFRASCRSVSLELGEFSMSSFRRLRLFSEIRSFVCLAAFLAPGILGHQASGQSIEWLKLNGPDGGSVRDLEYSSTFGPVASTSGGVYAFHAADQAWRLMGSLRDVTTELVLASNSEFYTIAEGSLYRWSSSEGEWQSIILPDSIVATSVAADESKIILGSRDGVFRSLDYGETWEALGLSAKTVWDLKLVGPAVIAAIEGEGIYRSGDGGGTWNLTVRGSFRVLYQGSDRLYAGEEVYDDICPGTLWLSSDEGVTWQRTSFNCRAVFSVLETSQTLLVGSDDGVFSSDINDLSQWESWDLTGKSVRALSETNLGILAGTRVAGVFVRSDAESSWASLSSGIAQTKVVRVQPDRYGRVFVGTAGTYGVPGSLCWTRDKGSAWSCVEEDTFEAVGVRAVAVTSDLEFYAGTDAGVFWTNDAGVTWNPLTEGIGERILLDLAASSDGTLWAAAQSGIYRLGQKESAWTNLGFANVFDVQVRNDTVYATPSDGLARSTDGGLSWRILLSGVRAYRIAFANDMIFVGTYGDGLFRSTDGGSTWRHSGFADESIWALAGSGGGTLFVSTRDGLFRSTDSGNSWDLVGFDDREVNDLAFGPDGLLYVATDNDGVHRSTNEITSSVEPIARSYGGKIEASHFPNPTNGDLQIQLTIDAPNVVSIELFDVLGRTVQVLYEGWLPAGRQAIRANLATHPAGTYVIQTRSGGRLSTTTLSLYK